MKANMRVLLFAYQKYYFCKHDHVCGLRFGREQIPISSLCTIATDAPHLQWAHQIGDNACRNLQTNDINAQWVIPEQRVKRAVFLWITNRNVCRALTEFHTRPQHACCASYDVWHSVTRDRIHNRCKDTWHRYWRHDVDFNDATRWSSHNASDNTNVSLTIRSTMLSSDIAHFRRLSCKKMLATSQKKGVLTKTLSIIFRTQSLHGKRTQHCNTSEV